MESNGGMSVADIAALNNGGMGGMNGFFWVFALLLLAGGNFGGFGNNFNNAIGYENLATSNEVQRGFDNQNLQAQTRDILSNVTAGTAQAVAATNQAKYDNINVMKDVQMALSNQIADVRSMEQNILANQNECCCSTKMMIADNAAAINSNIAQNRYEAAMNTAAINANTTAQTQKILDAMAQNKIESLQAQVNQLQLAQATAGMLRFPNQWSYGAGPFPPIFGGCAQANI